MACFLPALGSPTNTRPDHDNLRPEPNSPASLLASDITTLLPCSEGDFADRREPSYRTALDDAPRTTESPGPIPDPGRSLFASLVKIRHYWGIIARGAMSSKMDLHPWEPQSDFAKMVSQLKWWEHGLSAEHTWNPASLRSYRSVGQDVVSLGFP